MQEVDEVDLEQCASRCSTGPTQIPRETARNTFVDSSIFNNVRREQRASLMKLSRALTFNQRRDKHTQKAVAVNLQTS